MAKFSEPQNFPLKLNLTKYLIKKSQHIHVQSAREENVSHETLAI